MGPGVRREHPLVDWREQFRRGNRAPSRAAVHGSRVIDPPAAIAGPAERRKTLLERHTHPLELHRVAFNEHVAVPVPLEASGHSSHRVRLGALDVDFDKIDATRVALVEKRIEGHGW